MHKTKKKTAKLPKPIKVKKEKTDEERLPQPMSHYIDDRLELVKQVFGTLKPKTIINLAPDFIKSQGLEEIQEACLNELLCISTKRLKSIITATKCPSDTESSDDDDDVQRKEEHVSLEEISSDSEIGGGGTSKKGKKKKSSKIAEKDKTNTKTDKSKSVAEAGGNPEDGQISVLELLELQARARAIRSQLALEPVTKIEVDSDNEVADKEIDTTTTTTTTDNNKREQKSKKDKKSHKTTERKRTSSTRESLDSTKTNPKSLEKESERKAKKIKIKRNYRNTTSSTQAREMEEHKANDEVVDTAATNKETDTNQSQVNGNNKKQDQNQASEKFKKERSSRSISPDVIPIVAETETLLIHDSSDEAEVKNNSSQVTEDDKPQKSDKNDDVEKESETTDEATVDSKTAESEEGEICDKTDEDEKFKNLETAKSPESNTEIQKQLPESNTKDQNDFQVIKPNTDSEKNEHEESDKSIKPNNSSEKNGSSTSANQPTTDDVDEDEDQNDDVISLGEDLEDEMNEQLENEVNGSSFKVDNSEVSSSSEKPVKKARKEKSKVTESKDETTADNQSWHSRYMKSSKVSKVLAASRLGKRVRDKIKKSKEKSKDKPRESEVEKEEPAYSSKHEDGSLDQYKELLELRNRKSK